MNICGQCGETANYGGYAVLPGQELVDKWRCFSCLIADVKKDFDAKGIFNPKVMVVKPEEKKLQ